VALPLFNAKIAATDYRRVKPPAKKAASIYQTPEFKAWRAAVVERAGGRCEAINPDGKRCWKAAPYHRMFADHRREIRDGGAPFDVENGQCLCGAHHTAKTMEARAQRRS
jgi:hypothetical protein